MREVRHYLAISRFCTAGGLNRWLMIASGENKRPQRESQSNNPNPYSTRYHSYAISAETSRTRPRKNINRGQGSLQNATLFPAQNTHHSPPPLSDLLEYGRSGLVAKRRRCDHLHHPQSRRRRNWLGSVGTILATEPQNKQPCLVVRLGGVRVRFGGAATWWGIYVRVQARVG